MRDYLAKYYTTYRIIHTIGTTELYILCIGTCIENREDGVNVVHDLEKKEKKTFPQ